VALLPVLRALVNLEAAMFWLKAAVVLLVAVVALWGVATLYGQSRWQARTDALLGDLAAARVPLAETRYDPAMIEGLPPPVQRYLRAVLTPGQPMVLGVTMTHEGSFNMGEAVDNWKPFQSTQTVTTSRPGFVWDASVQMAPGLPVRVHDAYVAGEGVLVPAVLGLYQLMEMRGTGDIAVGELMRYLAEAPWYPTALLPGQGVVWSPIDDTSALATLTDGPVTVSLTFRFGADDMIASGRTEARGRTIAGKVVPTPWQGRWFAYERHDGMLVPTKGEVAWQLPDGEKPYWRGQVTSLRYDFAS
jgi:hypothetical protein